MSAFTCFYNQYCVLQMLFFLLASCQIFRGRFVANFQTTHHACRVRGHFVGQEDFGIFMFRWDWKRKVRGDELLRFEAARGSARTLNTSERERFWMNLVFPDRPGPRQTDLPSFCTEVRSGSIHLGMAPPPCLSWNINRRRGRCMLFSI